MQDLKDKSLKQGSALLVVLGFLTFITISAVAFAIYMRVERQATSNYRHSIAARHLLETALFRAMDEIDGELRLESVSRFPDWPGRVRASPAVYVNSTDPVVRDRSNYRANAQEARLLSFEALSFLPAVVVNGVRAYAVSTSTNASDMVVGAKWRTLSMPIQHKVNTDSTSGGVAVNSAGQSIVGRYAYLCVNLSDMLDVNNSSVLARSVVDQIGIAHLFQSPDTFNTQRSNDVTYATLQDFYNCMAGNSESSQFFERGIEGATTDSPYMTFLRTGQNWAFAHADNHVLVTDGFAKSEPRRAAAFNLRDSLFEQTNPPQFKPAVETALSQTFLNALPPGGQNMFLSSAMPANGQNRFAAMVYDYLSTDVAPSRFDVPSLKLAPKISRIFVTEAMTPKTYLGTPPPGPTPQPTPIYVRLVCGDQTGASMNLDEVTWGGIVVHVCWPFRNIPDARRNGSYTVELEGWIHLHPDTTVQLDAGSFPNFMFSTGIRFTGTSGPINNNMLNPQTMEQCYVRVPINITFQGSPDFEQQIGEIPAGGGTPNMNTGFVNGLSTSIIIFAKVLRNGVVVDSVPQIFPYPTFSAQNPYPLTEQFEMTPKIYFQSELANSVNYANQENPLGWAWDSLEVPDPRFNHRASNWMKIPSAFRNSPDQLSSWLTGLLGDDGRDSDLFMSVAGTGRLHSPGELGFIIRPYNYHRDRGSQVNYHTRTGWDTAEDDSDAFFRTVRLYNHGGGSDPNPLTEKYDPIYEYFYATDDFGNFLNSRARVNPLSQHDTILMAAINRVPHDYWFAVTNVTTTAFQANHIELSDNVIDRWVDSVIDLVRNEGIGREYAPYKSIRTEYPKLRWYYPPPSLGQLPNRIFDASATLSEVERKMLYAFSQDSFSDRQQLFLYILQAESTAPVTGGEALSLAGGKAVALVWRDPYPTGTTVQTGPFVNNNTTTGQMNRNGQIPNVNLNQLYEYANQFASQSFYSERLMPSPWWRVKNPTLSPPTTPPPRSGGHHEHRILFFKQLTN